MRPISITFLLGALCCASVLQAAEDGFEPLFGSDGLKGWKVSDWSDLRTPQKVQGTPWKLENGVLYGLNKRTWIMSPERYGDFVLKLETKITRGSNGGIGLRFPLEGDPAYKAMEIQVVDHETYYRGRSQPKQRTGSIYDEIAPSKDVVKPPGEWNSWEITARGSRVTIVLNGEKIVDVDLSRETKARQQKGPALAERPLKGHIGFQNLNGSITLRNIRIKKLDAAAGDFVPLFNGRNLDGWVNVNCAPETWTVRDGMIVCTGIPTGVLRTDRHYENFVLELEWRHMKKGGNAGLFIHSDPVTALGKPFTRSIEVQIMDGNAGDMFSIHGATMRTDKPHPKGWMRSLPSEDRMNPTGQWNHYRVESRDGTATLAVNGKVVTRGYDLNPRKGYICLESEGSEIHFRNIRIKKLPSSDPPAAMVAAKAQGFRCLYNGLDLRAWKNVPGHEGHWQAKNWVLDYDGKSEAKDKHLWTEEEFGDFVLIVDVRRPGKPPLVHAPVLLPAEVSYGTTAPVDADNQQGQWTRFVITAVDDAVTVVRNGKVLIDRAKLTGVSRKGPIALQHNGNPIQFANIYVKKLD